jgi:hypothetical protein
LESPSKNLDSTCCFVRIFQDLPSHLSDAEARNFIDLSGKDLDAEAQSLLASLRDQQVPGALPKERLLTYSLNWTERGVDPADPAHRAYLDDFLERFYSLVTEMVEKAAREEERLLADYSRQPIVEEVLAHLTFCKHRCEGFRGREETLQAMAAYLETSKNGEAKGPFVLHGESGCGKTSMIAKAVELILPDPTKKKPSPLGRQVVVAARFLGTTAASSNLGQLLRSLCTQLWHAYGQEPAALSLPEDHTELVDFFQQGCLTLASGDRPLVLFLDSLDQLSPAFNSQAHTWLPRLLPPYVSLVVSCISGGRGLSNLQQKFSGPPAAFHQVPTLPKSLGMEILEDWLGAEGRTLTKEQHEVVRKALDQCSLPLYLRLVFNEVRRWTSHTPADQLSLPQTIQGMIEALFDRVERRHGRTLVAHAFGFLTASRGGLTEAELEDLLSLDDDVLGDVFQYWLPPVRRLPPLLWTRIRADVDDYLTEKEVDGSLVIYWYHRQFIEVATMRYLGTGEVYGSPLLRPSTSQAGHHLASQLHGLLAEYFAGVWANQKKPFAYSEKQVTLFHLSGPSGEEDRRVTSQPLIFPGGLSPFTLLCFALLCFALLCFALLCFALLCLAFFVYYFLLID